MDRTLGYEPGDEGSIPLWANFAPLRSGMMDMSHHMRFVYKWLHFPSKYFLDNKVRYHPRK